MKLVTYKRINRDAAIFGFPFMVFFIALMWTILSGIILFAAPASVKFIWFFIYAAGILLIYVVYKKYGLKTVQKEIELFFKNADVIRYNQSMFIKKIKIDL